jgi:transposase
MAAAIALRADYESTQLRELARQSEDADQVRRLLALALVYDGGSRSAGARAGGVGLQTFRDWVLRFNAKGPAGLVDGKAAGQVPRLDRAQRGELAQLVEDGPILGVHGVVRWRLSDLAAWVMEKYRTSISEQTLSRYLREMGYRKLSARPRHHAQNREAVAEFKKRMARPVCKDDFTGRVGLHQRIRSQGLIPGQDGMRAPRA